MVPANRIANIAQGRGNSTFSILPHAPPKIWSHHNSCAVAGFSSGLYITWKHCVMESCELQLLLNSSFRNVRLEMIESVIWPAAFSQWPVLNQLSFLLWLKHNMHLMEVTSQKATSADLYRLHRWLCLFPQWLTPAVTHMGENVCLVPYLAIWNQLPSRLVCFAPLNQVLCTTKYFFQMKVLRNWKLA